MRLEFALVQWGLAKLHARGFMPVIPPVLVKREAMVGTGFFPEAEAQVYALATDELFLVGTAEVPLASLHGGDMLAADDLPLHYVGFSIVLPARGRRGAARTRAGSSACTSSTSSSSSATATPTGRGTSRRRCSRSRRRSRRSSASTTGS